MRIYLLRHGIAEDESPDGSDEARRLTDMGVRKTRRVLKGLAGLIEAPDVILTSPLVRARQTAEIAAERFGSPLEEVDVLGRAAPQRIIAMLTRRDEASVMAVGHEPTFSTIVEMLICPHGERGFIEFKKAGCACLELSQASSHPRGRLIWLATPKLLAAR